MREHRVAALEFEDAPHKLLRVLTGLDGEALDPWLLAIPPRRRGHIERLRLASKVETHTQHVVGLLHLRL